ncbi:MAG TPA: hypothetical protein VGV59_17305 [Pyrinomonadaceae bacterium]|nr:hypothetical protein [Pyrinomonadaceae bacterium]
MQQLKQIRVVKRDEKRRAQQEATLGRRKAAAAAERDVKDVVSSWVSEHRRRSEEFRRNYSTLLSELGLSTPRGARAV